MKGNIKITPLGGVGQIGSNCTLIQTKNDNILIDCGILFPYEDFYDLNYLIPDLSEIEHKVSTIIITHGHEDHIGAIHHYIEKFPEAKIYAPLFAKKLIENKLEYKKMSKKIYLLDNPVHIDTISINPVHVNHSIPHTRGLAITHDDSKSAILFISDFKVDKETPYEDPIDLDFIKKLGEEYDQKIALLDSTNILSSNTHTPSEAHLYKGLKEAIETTTGTVFITTFASNIHRIQSIIKIASELNRAVIPYGRSMLKYIETAIEVGEIDDHGVIKDAEDRSIKRQKVVLLSGSQGEHRGTVRRVISRQDKRYKIHEGDKFIFSSKAIPGNEKKLSMLYNDIIEQGADLLTSNESLIHASGHPGRDDLKEVYEAFRPTHSFPIHGESLFLKAHVKFILDNQLSNNAEMILNRDSIEVGDKVLVKNIEKGIEPVIYHGNDIILERERISERRKVATQGAVLVSFSKATVQKYRPSFEVTLVGLPTIADDDVNEFKEYLGHLVKENKGKALEDSKEQIRIATRRFFGERLGYRPVAIVHIC